MSVGIAFGFYFPAQAVAMKPLGDGFIKLIKVFIAPIIFCTVVLGIAGAKDLKKVGRTGGLALVYFEVVSTIALIVGLVIVNIVQPGSGMDVDPASLDSAAVSAYSGSGKSGGVVDFVLKVIPTTFFDAFAKGEILQVLLLAVLFGLAVNKIGSYSGIVMQAVEGFSKILFTLVSMVMVLAPVAAFGAMSFTIGAYGLGTLLSLAKLMATFYLTCLIFILVVLGGIAMANGFRITALLRHLRDEILVVLSTSSSETVLPQLMAKLEWLGIGRTTVGLVVPTGYSFNLDGTSIYLTMAAVFIAQATNTPLTPTANFAGCTAPYFKGSRWCHRQRIHRARRNAVLAGRCSDSRCSSDFGHRPFHVGSASNHECHRKRGCHDRRCPLDRGS